MKAVLEVFTA